MPASFTDALDRLEAATSRLQQISAAHENTSAKPSFTRAVLHVSPHHLIREAEPWETALFARVAPPPGPRAPALDAAGAPAVALGPVPVDLATPLRPKPGRRRVAASSAEPAFEPEEYAQAGIRLLERYDEIRPMPRAKEMLVSILEQCALERKEISDIEARRTQKTNPANANGDDTDLARTLKQEEAKLKIVQKEIEQLRKRRDELLKKKVKPQTKTDNRRPPPPSSVEAAFWDSPDPISRTRPVIASSKDSLLSSESLAGEPRLADLSADFSIGGPGPIFRPGAGSPTPARSKPITASAPTEEPKAQPAPPPPSKPIFDLARLSIARSAVDDDFDEEPTVILKRPPLSFDEPKPTSSSHENGTAEEASSNAQHTRGLSDKLDAPSVPETDMSKLSLPASKSNGSEPIRITSAVEAVFTKMWSTVGDTLLPGRSSNPPDAHATLAHLAALSTDKTSPEAQSSMARLILALLRAPGMAMPLKTLNTVVGGSAASKTLYAGVGKRLLRIERGGGEQTVKFTV